MRRLMAVGLALLGLLTLWAVYLVPVASVLNVGFGSDGFRQYQPYVYARVRGAGPTSGDPGNYVVSVASCLAEGSTAWLLTAGGEHLNVAGRIDSEVETEQNWLFPRPKDDPPVRLVVRAGGVEHQWSLAETGSPRYEPGPWWYRIAPSWSERSLARRVGLADALEGDLPAGPEDSAASVRVQLLHPERIEVWRPGSEGADAILGHGLTGPGPEVAYRYNTGEPLRSYSFTVEDAKVGGQPVRILKAGGTLLGIKRDPSAVVQSAVSPSGAFALVTTDKEVALVRGDGLQLISPASYKGTDLARWGQNLSQVKLFTSPVVSDAGVFALRVMVPDEKGVTVVSVWRGDIDSGRLHPVLVGKEGDANNIAGFLPDGRLVVWGGGLGVLTVDAEGNVSRVGPPGLTAESVSSQGLIFAIDGSLRPSVVVSDSVTLPLEGLPDGSVFSYGGAWAPDGTRVAFLAGKPDAAPYLVVAEFDGKSFRVVGEFTPPDPGSTFVAGGLIDWANDFEVAASTHGRDGDKTWVFRIGGEGAVRAGK